jgi:hypothetical protein
MSRSEFWEWMRLLGFMAVLIGFFWAINYIDWEKMAQKVGIELKQEPVEKTP